jgi:hypothetical protein
MYASIQKLLIHCRTILLVAAAFVLGALKANTEGNEYQIKAMFVFNFTKYVEWPDVNQDVFSIGVVGESEIIEHLERIAIQKKVGDKKIVIRRLTSEDDTYCNTVIVSRSRTAKLDAIEKKYAGKGVLIISDESPRSAAINLVTRDNKIRFEINPSAAKSGGIKISSQLISLAITVH